MHTASLKTSPVQLAGMRPDNHAMAIKMARAREAQQRNGSLSGMGDFMDTLPYRVMRTRSPGQELGPLMTPVIPGPESFGELDYLREILAELRRMPENIWQEHRTRFPTVPREAISFIAPSVDVSIPAGTAGTVVSQVTQERFSGFLTHVGVNVISGSFDDITWQIRINGAIHPEFRDRVFSQNTVNNPLPFVFELTQSRTVELVAINSAAVDIEVQGILVGWTEFLSNFKFYGSSPQSGIS